MKIWCFALLAPFVIASAQIPPDATLPSSIRDSAVCQSPGGELLRFLKLAKGTRFVKYHYATGGVPRSSMDRDGFPYISLLYVSNSGRKGILAFVFLLPDGKIVTDSNLYLMHKTKQGWEASDGNGGPGMYRRVEDFVDELMKKPIYQVDLHEESKETCMSQQEWEAR